MAKSKMAWKREQERRKRERKRRDKRRMICAVVAVLLAVITVIMIFSSKGCSEKKTANNTTVNSAESTEGVATELPETAPYKSAINISEVNVSFFDNSVFLGNSVADTIAMYDLLHNTDFYTSPILSVDNVYTTIVGYGNTAAIDQLKSKKFSKVFLSFGEREIASGDDYEFESSYKSLLEKVKSYQVNAQIYLIGIPPSDKKASDEARYGMSLENIKNYNKIIRSIATDQNVYYINSVSALGGSYLYNGVSADGINLNRDCCIELLKYITDNAYIPEGNKSDSSDDKEKTTQKPSKKNEDKKKENSSSSDHIEPTDTPIPTVNVLKDSAKIKNGD